MSSKSSNAEGNTKTSARQISPAKHWCFTWNNYPEGGSGCMEEAFRSTAKAWVFQEEVGESGTPHFQGYVEFTDKLRPLSLGLDEKIHWEKKKKTVKNCIDYCSDPDKRADDGQLWYHGLVIPKPLKLIEPTYQWEKDILEIIKEDPDDRLIYWYWSEKGNIGKTAFCKYLHAKHGATPLHGKGADVRNGAVNFFKMYGATPELVVYPIPRSYDTDFISYEGLESIKDMFFYSGKYEGGVICGNPPHLFVFANTPPNEAKMSADRWRVVQIDAS